MAVFHSRRSLMVFLLWHAALSLHGGGSHTVAAQESATAQGGHDDDDDDRVELVHSLAEMNDAQLEAICANRGFELLTRDETTGATLSWSHEDYVEAAQQCLDVEAEMEKLMKDRPDIVQELEQERDEMQARKDMLEAELAAKLRPPQTLEEEEEKMGTAFVDDGNVAAGGADNTGQSSSSSTSTTASARSVKKDKIQPLPHGAAATSAAAHDRLKFASLMKESMVELRDQIRKDWTMVSNTVLPPSVRGPLHEKVVKPLIRIAKHTGNSAFALIKKYLLLLIDTKLKKQTPASV